MTQVYTTSPVKRRRRTNAQLAEVDEAIAAAVRLEHPVTIPPTTLRSIVEDAITQHIDPEALRLTRIAEDSERELLYAMRGGAR